MIEPGCWGSLIHAHLTATEMQHRQYDMESFMTSSIEVSQSSGATGNLKRPLNLYRGILAVAQMRDRDAGSETLDLARTLCVHVADAPRIPLPFACILMTECHGKYRMML